MSKIVLKNIGFLTLSQFANYIIPLITIPYVTRIVGINNYGIVEFGITSMLFFSVIVIYGFHTTGTRKVAKLSGDMQLVSKLFSSIISARLILLLISTVGFLIAISTIGKFQEQSKMLFYAFPIILGWAIYPEFIFQGLQKLKVVAIANFSVKLFAAVLIILLVSEKEDFYLILGINSFSQIAVGIITLIYALRKVDGLKFIKVSIKEIIETLKEGANIFLSLFFTRVNSFGVIFILGLLLSEYQLGQFASSLKLITVSQSFLLMPLWALFPHLNELYVKDLGLYRRKFNTFLIAFLIAAVLGSLILFVFPKLVLGLLFGSEYENAAPFLKIMAPILISSVLGYFSLYQGLLVLKKDKLFLKIIVFFGLFSTLCYFMFLESGGLEAAAWIKVLSDFVMAIVGFVIFRKAFSKEEFNRI